MKKSPKNSQLSRPADGASGLLDGPYARSRHATALAICGAILCIAGVVLAFGGLLDAPRFTLSRAEWAPMPQAAALSFAVLGSVFFFLRGSRFELQTQAPLIPGIGAVALFAVASLLGGTVGPLQGSDLFALLLSPLAATGVLTIAVASGVIATGYNGRLPLARYAAVLVAGLGIFGSCAYLFNAAAQQNVSAFNAVSLDSAVLFLVAAVGLASATPERGLCAVLLSSGPGSNLVRWLSPALIAVPLVFALLVSGLLATTQQQLSMAALATATMLALGAMLAMTGLSMNQADLLRRRADAAFENHAIRRRILFEQAKDGIAIIGPGQQMVEINASFAEMLGYRPAAVMKLHPWDWIVDSATRGRVVSDWADLAVEDATFNATLRRRDGELIDAELSCTTAGFDEQSFLFLVCRDVTHRKRAQTDLYASEQRFRRALANIPDVVVIYDKDLRIQYANTAIRLLTGHAQEDFIDKRDEDVLPASVCEEYLPSLRRAVQTRQICAVECDVDMPGVGYRALRVTCVPLMDRDGEVREVMGITRDLTDRREAERTIRSSEAKFRQLIEQAPAGIIIADPNGTIELVNGYCCELLNTTEKALLDRPCVEVLAASGGAAVVDKLQALRPGKPLRFESVLKRSDDATFPAEIAIYMLASGAQQVTFQDITSRHLQEQKIERLHRIQAVTSSINSAIVRLRDRQELLRETCRVAVDEGRFCAGWVGVIDHDNGELKLTTQQGMGKECEALLGKAVDLVAEGAAENAIFQQLPRFDNDIARHPDATRLRGYASERGAKSVVSLPLIVEGETFGVVVLYANERNFFDDEEINLLRELAEDVSFGLEFIAKEERVDYLAYYDMMTGLPNRSLFFNRLSRQLQDGQRKGVKTVLCVLDIDRFRMINDTYGRHEGDAVIAEAAQRLSAIVSDEDTVARISANTFALAISASWEEADIVSRLEEIGAAMFAAAYRIGDDDVRVSATAGAALYPDNASSPEELLFNAEAALRSAKSRNSAILLYSRDLHERVAESLRFESKVRSAVDNEELAMWYQPKVCSTTGQLRGFEALMRWKDPETGKMIPPDTFIPVMEHTGVILQAGRWALQQVASDCLRWQAQGVTPPRVAVNVSPIQLAHQNLVGSLIEAQVVANSAGTALDLEITESVIMDNVDSIIPRLRTLSSVGTRIHVDDFGTGYSSLAYIARLPIDALKIDRSFVTDLRPDSEGLGIVKSIISLAKAMKLQVIAEGVETAEQVTLLRDLGCDELQGYHIGRPLPADETLSVIQRLTAASENTL